MKSLLYVYMLDNTSDITVVYKTYAKDFEWLYYSLQSVKKYVRGIKEVIIYCHDISRDELYTLVNKIEFPCRIIPVAYNYHGYMKQTVVKATCYKDVNTKYICIIDSDIIFHTEFNIKEYILPSGKIPWHYWNNLQETAAEKIWSIAYESATKTKQNVHYLVNGFPFFFTTDSLKAAADKFYEMHGVDYDTYCMNRCALYKIIPGEAVTNRFGDLAKVFSEFEWLGFYCHNYSEDYIFIEYNLPIPTNRMNVHKQFWSHGGLTPNIRTEIEALIK
jgi:hypothetical protein